MKNFYTAQDIEDLAAQGKTELIIDENTVLTDLARHMADQLGISITNRSQTASATPTPPRRPPGPPVGGGPRSVRTPITLGSKPKGCQHGPLTTQQSSGPTPVSTSSNPAAPNTNTVVDQLVGLVKRLGGKGPAS